MSSHSEICRPKDIGYLVLEHIVKNMPSVYFFYASWVNYKVIYELSYERAYKFSCLFKTKLVTVRLMVLIAFINLTVESCSYAVWKYVPVHELIQPDHKKTRRYSSKERTQPLLRTLEWSYMSGWKKSETSTRQMWRSDGRKE